MERQNLIKKMASDLLAYSKELREREKNHSAVSSARGAVYLARGDLSEWETTACLRLRDIGGLEAVARFLDCGSKTFGMDEGESPGRELYRFAALGRVGLDLPKGEAQGLIAKIKTGGEMTLGQAFSVRQPKRKRALIAGMWAVGLLIPCGMALGGMIMGAPVTASIGAAGLGGNFWLWSLAGSYLSKVGIEGRKFSEEFSKMALADGLAERVMKSPSVIRLRNILGEGEEFTLSGTSLPDPLDRDGSEVLGGGYIETQSWDEVVARAEAALFEAEAPDKGIPGRRRKL